MVPPVLIDASSEWQTLGKGIHAVRYASSKGVHVSSIGCILNVESWNISESFDCKSSSFTDPQSDYYLFGTVSDSDEQVLDGFTFQIKFSQTVSPKYEVSISEDHVFVCVGLPLPEIIRLEKQMYLDNIRLGFGLNLRFVECFTFELPENKDCSVLSFHKSVIKSHNKRFKTDSLRSAT